MHARSSFRFVSSPGSAAVGLTHQDHTAGGIRVLSFIVRFVIIMEDHRVRTARGCPVAADPRFFCDYTPKNL